MLGIGDLIPVALMILLNLFLQVEQAVIADMSGAEGSSNDTSLSIDVSGPSHITNYRYVIGNGSLNCDGASYSLKFQSELRLLIILRL